MTDISSTIFDPQEIIDQATYTEAMLPSKGIEHVLVAGVPVVSGGVLDKTKLAGKAIRAGGK
jgi:N-acyl-D-amino-acid deacylase